MSTSKDMKCLLKTLQKSGWLYFRGSKHGRIKSPDGKVTLTVPGTPSDRRAFMNFRQDVRRSYS